MNIYDTLLNWVIRIIIAVGILFMGIGTYLVVSGGLNLAFFDTPRYDDTKWREGECDRKWDPTFVDIYAPEPAKPRPAFDAMSDEEKKEKLAECKDKAQSEAKEDFKRDQKGSIVDGLAFLLTGLLLWLVYKLLHRKCCNEKCGNDTAQIDD